MSNSLRTSSSVDESDFLSKENRVSLKLAMLKLVRGKAQQV